MEIIVTLTAIVIIGLGIAVMSEERDRTSGCYKRSRYSCSICRNKACRYHKIEKILEDMENKEED